VPGEGRVVERSQLKVWQAVQVVDLRHEVGWVYAREIESQKKCAGTAEQVHAHRFLLMARLQTCTHELHLVGRQSEVPRDNRARVGLTRRGHHIHHRHIVIAACTLPAIWSTPSSQTNGPGL